MKFQAFGEQTGKVKRALHSANDPPAEEEHLHPPKVTFMLLRLLFAPSYTQSVVLCVLLLELHSSRR